MGYLASTLNPRVLARLTEAQLNTLTAAIDAEIIKNPEIHKILEAKTKEFIREFKVAD
jgi:hypothetical protein